MYLKENREYCILNRIKVSPIILTFGMATIALMIGGAVLNATAFVGGSYLAKYLSGSDVDTERVRHDKAIEKYQKDYAAYQEKRQRLLDWYNQQRDEEHQASQNLFFFFFFFFFFLQFNYLHYLWENYLHHLLDNY